MLIDLKLSDLFHSIMKNLLVRRLILASLSKITETVISFMCTKQYDVILQNKCGNCSKRYLQVKSAHEIVHRLPWDLLLSLAMGKQRSMWLWSTYQKKWCFCGCTL